MFAEVFISARCAHLINLPCRSVYNGASVGIPWQFKRHCRSNPATEYRYSLWRDTVAA